MKCCGMARIISLHISLVLKCPGTNNIMHSLLRTTSLPVFWVLKRSGTYANESGSTCTASLHISWALRWSVTTFMQLVMFIFIFRQGVGQPKQIHMGWKVSLRQKCRYSELFCSVFSCIWTEYGEISLWDIRISPYSVRMLENGNQNNSEHEHFLRSVFLSF